MHKAHILGRTFSTAPIIRLLAIGAIALLPALAAASEAWYIGPKGGDTRKGILMSPLADVAGPGAPSAPRMHCGTKGCVSLGTAYPTTGIPSAWQPYVGPKGGVTRKGLY